MEKVLETIVTKSRIELADKKLHIPVSNLEQMINSAPKTRGFKAALQRDGVQIIAELKSASPSKGVIREHLDIEHVAPELENAGAAALSVLTEENFFLGSLKNLQIARESVSIPLLRKDFIYDEYQILEARVYGADAILLIAAMLSVAEFRRLYSFAGSLGLDVLCEAHTAEELAMLLDNGAEIVGVNARNLSTFNTSLELAGKLIGQIPPGKVAVSESAIKNAEDVKQLQALGAKAFLIGETLMRSEHPGEMLCKLLSK
ncbi:MAG: indole-3-glycerol phosphate synthase TrpC [Victivallales bacterium]|jgi:indole-3-glycerol phosphate synthase|nr:indole-3-glycerol phosphate synthase TrpC [Victivallales bacterium]